MRIAVLGTGMVGSALAGRLAELGHTVTMGTRDPANTLRRDERPTSAGVPLETFADAARASELVIVATNGAATLDVLRLAAEETLAGKVLVDVTNPLDSSSGFPPTLLVKDTDSLAEQIQRTFPGARVVKTLNTVNAALMVRPAELAGGDHTVFVSGDDPAAKQAVTSLLLAMGHTDVIDLGELSTARGAEMYLPLWLRLMGVLGTARFQIKVVRDRS